MENLQGIYQGVHLGSAPVEGKGRKQGWAEGEVRLQCHLNESLIHLYASSRAFRAVSSGSEGVRLLDPPCQSDTRHGLPRGRGDALG